MTGRKNIFLIYKTEGRFLESNFFTQADGTLKDITLEFYEKLLKTLSFGFIFPDTAATNEMRTGMRKMAETKQLYLLIMKMPE